MEDEAATTWGALIYLRKHTSVTFKEMGEMFLQQAYQKHTAYALWGQWTMLRQIHGKSGQKYCDRVRDLQAQESMPDLWAVSALIRGLREPLRTRFYESLTEGEDRTLSLDEAARRFVRFEMT